MLKTRQPIWHSACTNVESLAMSVFHIPSDTNPTVKCSKSHILEPENLCLFGASRKASELKNPGYISKSKLQPNSIWLNHSVWIWIPSKEIVKLIACPCGPCIQTVSVKKNQIVPWTIRKTLAMYHSNYFEDFKE